MSDMRRVHVLLPYALAATAVVVASAIALAATVRTTPTGLGAPAASAEPSSGARVTALSDVRMAYWRPTSNGALELWVSDLDGDHRSRIATAGADTDLALTRWSPDGTAVGYTIAGGTIGIAWLDASNATVPMPSQLRAARWKIVGYEWSPDAKRIAATFRAANGLSNESEVYVADAKASAGWERVTTMGDAFAGHWIDGDRLFIETSSGMIAVLDLSTKAIRPITGMPATSPLVGRDGRVYFAGGRSVGGDVASLPVANGWVWSATIDGDDLRKETMAELAQTRLFGILADGRAVTGVPGGVYFAADTLVPLAFVGAGTVRRVVVSDDGRRVIGLTDSRILQIDAAKIPRALAPGTLPPVAAATTLLSGLRDADVWAARRAVTLSRSAAPTGGPRARLAFLLGRTLWSADPDGSVRTVLSEPTFFISTPRWSPSGERLAAIVTSGSPERAYLVVSGPRLTKRWEIPALATPYWSADGASVAVWYTSGPLAEWTTQSYDAETGVPGERITGRALWTTAGRMVLTDGEIEPPSGNAPPSGIRTGQRIELIDGSARRAITDARRIAASALLRDVPDATLPPFISQLLPSGDPAYVGVTLSRARQGGTSSNAFVVVRVSDGEPVYVLSMPIQSGAFDLTWSSVGHLLGWSVSEPSGPGGTFVRRAILVDPIERRTLFRADGRFAGWTPDGQWAYVARDEGLFAHRVDGSGDPVRVSPIGVPVVATKP